MKAIITGASSGIGHALAKRLAREKYDLVLVARREDKLRDLSRELERDHGIKAEVLVLDVTLPDAPRRLLEVAGDADLVVNNAGYGKHAPVVDVSIESATGMVRLNCEALTGVLQAFLPRMVARKSGTILNVASVAAFQPIPHFAVYAATKAYVLSLSIAADAEVKRHGVRVLTLCPGPVPTEFQAVSGTTMDHAPGFLQVTAERCADEAYWMIRRGKRTWVPNWFLRNLIRLEALVPQCLVVFLAGRAVPPPPVQAPASPARS